MKAIEEYILTHPGVAWVVLIAMFVVLAKCADIFVESAVAIAEKLDVPKLVIGIVLVSLATTAPELTVSLVAALKGDPEVALGNAIGSVICDNVALGFAGVLSVAPIVVMPRVLRTSGIFLVVIMVTSFLFVAWDFTLSRWEGLVLLVLFIGYVANLFRLHKKGELKGEEIEEDIPADIRRKSIPALLVLFALGLIGIIGSSDFIVVSAKSIAISINIPQSVIALTLIAFGTSVPEVATCIAAARKGHGEIAIGNILGADIMNICWVAGASAVANDLTLGGKEVWFMFPAMLIMIVTMLIMLHHKHRLSRRKGAALILLYVVYLVVLILLFPPQPGGAPPPAAAPAAPAAATPAGP